MAKLKKATPKQRSEMELLRLRVEAMELREAMLKERLDRFDRNEHAMNELRGAMVELKSHVSVLYRSIENLRDDLKRGRTLRELPEPN